MILNIPIDNLSEDQIEQKILSLSESSNSSQICFISFRDIMRAQFNRELKSCFAKSELNIPITTSVRFAASWLKREKPVVHNPFTFVIRLLGVLEKYQKSIYILGSRKKNILQSEKNLKTSFPGLQIVGRYAGSFTRQEEKNVITAIKKSSPTLLLTGRGLSGNNLWLYKNSKAFNPGIIMWGRSCFEIFSGKKEKPKDMKGMKMFLEGFFSLILPWRLLRYILFFLLLTVEKIKSRAR